MDGLEFFSADGDTIIHNCFKAVLRQNKDNDALMLPDYRSWVEAANIIWPNSEALGNSFKYLWEQYRDNLKTNLTTHCEKRLKRFFKMRVFELNDFATTFNYFNNLFGTNDAMPYYDNIDINNAINYTYNRRDTTNGDTEREWRLGELLDELRWIGAPDDCNIRDFVKDHWFESLRMWTEMQRDIHMFHIAYADRRDKPKIHNFAVVPICSFQRRHIRIDTDALYNILCNVKKIPQKIGNRKMKDGTVDSVNISPDEFRKNPIASWNLFFDVERMLNFVHYTREFRCQICSDGVAATILYDAPKVEAEGKSDEEVIRMYRAKLFAYELGIDPGYRTWNATVRRNILTGEEVSSVGE